MADAAENAKPDAAPGTMQVRKDKGIGWMIYDQQAKYNAVTYDMRRAIPGIMADFEADDDVTEYRFENFRINQEIPAERFELELPPGVELEERQLGQGGSGL